MDSNLFGASLVGGFGRPSEEKKRSKSIDTIFGRGGQGVYESFTKKVPITTEEDDGSPVRTFKEKSSSPTSKISNESPIFKSFISKLIKNDASQGQIVSFDGRSFLLGIIVSNLTFLFKPFLTDLLNHFLRFLGGLLQISVVLAVVAGVVLYLHYSIISPKSKNAKEVSAGKEKKMKILDVIIPQDRSIEASEGDIIPVTSTRNDDAFTKFFENRPMENPKFKANATKHQSSRHQDHKPRYDDYAPKAAKEVNISENIIPKRLIMNDTEERIPVNFQGKKKINILPEELALLKKLAAEKYMKETKQRQVSTQPVDYFEDSRSLMSPKIMKNYQTTDELYHPHSNDPIAPRDYTNYRENHGIDQNRKIDIEESPIVHDNLSPATRDSSRNFKNNKLNWNSRKMNWDDNSDNAEHVKSSNSKYEQDGRSKNKYEQDSLLKTPMSSEFSFSQTPQSNIIMSDITNTNDMKRGKPFAGKSRRKLNNTPDENHSDLSNSSTIKGINFKQPSGVEQSLKEKKESNRENSSEKLSKNFDTLTIGTMSVMGDSVVDDASIFKSNVRINEDEDDDVISMLSGSSDTRKPGRSVRNNVTRMNTVSTAMSGGSKEYAQFVSKVN